jgi:hypothetical protein
VTKTVLPAQLSTWLESGLKDQGTSLAAASQLAESVKKLSDFYIQKPNAATPYEQQWARQAYLCYFQVLNWVRCAAVVQRGINVGFFSELNRWIDFGSGLGAASFALESALPQQFAAGLCIERSSLAISMHRSLRRASGLASAIEWGDAPINAAPQTVAMFSYSLTELSDLPKWALSCEALMLIEPATHQDGRKLQALRSRLMEKGFSIWAPCTHALACPLLTASERDWCHDRVAWDMPAWFAAIQKHLPIRNETLTFSYLLARKKPAPTWPEGTARLTGDLKKEKGAARQMVCRGEAREFLSWQKRDGGPPDWPRGARVFVDPKAAKKSNEIRVKPDEARLL